MCSAWPTGSWEEPPVPSRRGTPSPRCRQTLPRTGWRGAPLPRSTRGQLPQPHRHAQPVGRQRLRQFLTRFALVRRRSPRRRRTPNRCGREHPVWSLSPCASTAVRGWCGGARPDSFGGTVRQPCHPRAGDAPPRVSAEACYCGRAGGSSEAAPRGLSRDPGPRPACAPSSRRPPAAVPWASAPTPWSPGRVRARHRGPAGVGRCPRSFPSIRTPQRS